MPLAGSEGGDHRGVFTRRSVRLVNGVNTCAGALVVERCAVLTAGVSDVDTADDLRCRGIQADMRCNAVLDLAVIADVTLPNELLESIGNSNAYGELNLNVRTLCSVILNVGAVGRIVLKSIVLTDDSLAALVGEVLYSNDNLVRRVCGICYVVVVACGNVLLLGSGDGRIGEKVELVDYIARCEGAVAVVDHRSILTGIESGAVSLDVRAESGVVGGTLCTVEVSDKSSVVVEELTVCIGYGIRAQL